VADALWQQSGEWFDKLVVKGDGAAVVLVIQAAQAWSRRTIGPSHSVICFRSEFYVLDRNWDWGRLECGFHSVGRGFILSISM